MSSQREIAQILKEIEFEQRSKELRTIFLEKGIFGNWKGYGWGHMKTNKETGEKTFIPEQK